MAKKYSGHRKKKSIGKKGFNKNRNIDISDSRLDEQILDHLVIQKEPITSAGLAKNLNLPKSHCKKVAKILFRLEKEGKVKHKGKKYSYSQKINLFKATLDLTTRGFGFAAAMGNNAPEKDIFIAKQNINGALQGDTILIRVLASSRGRLEGRVVQIVQRGITRLCGIFTSGKKNGYVTPDNDRLAYTVSIPKDQAMNAADESAVIVSITDFGNERRNPEGNIVEILGDPYTVPVQISMALEQFKLSKKYPENALKQAKDLTPLTENAPDRVDLIHIEHVTIDGSTAKDFDDAIAVEKTKTGYILYVSIADVSHYVKPGSDIDREAYRRGTSVYLPNLVLPMLPERLSNDLCSLVPDQVRPAFTAQLTFNNKGKRINQTYCKSLIKSKQRFTYECVNSVLYLKDIAQQEPYKDLLPMLQNAKKLAKLLQKKRDARGSIGFNIPEPIIHLEKDTIASISRSERNQAHQLIEEFMLAANEAVGETLDTADLKVLFRIHERPDSAKVEQFTEAAHSLGLQLPKSEETPAWFAAVLDEAVDTPLEYVINNLLLRTMQRARYSPDNHGHFGLAAQHYLHFTSPIRRYPDLIAHRVLSKLLVRSQAQHKNDTQLTADNSTLTDAGTNLSKLERTAIDVERNVHARLSALYFRDRVGDEFQAIISGVTPFGLFVELTEFFVSGAIPVREMHDDYYIHDSRRNRLIGDLTGNVFQLGDMVNVLLNRVDMISKKLYFSFDITA